MWRWVVLLVRFDVFDGVVRGNADLRYYLVSLRYGGSCRHVVLLKMSSTRDQRLLILLSAMP